MAGDDPEPGGGALDEALAVRDQLRLALEAGRMGTWDWDVGSGRVWWSEQTGPLFGRERGHCPAGYAEYMSLLHPDDRELVQAAIERALADRSHEYRVRHRILDGSGEVRWLECRGQVQLDARKAPARMAGVVMDVTEVEQLERTLQQSQKMEAVGTLASGVAHDFNNLLAVILGQAELLQLELRDSPHVTEALLAIKQATTRAGDLTRQLLAFARKQHVEPVRLDLRDVVTRVGEMLRRLLGETIELDVDLPSAPCPVRAGRSQLEQLIVNLAVNARDAMPDGGTLQLRVRLRQAPGPEGSDEQERVVLEVRDTGDGMEPAVAARIFEPFFTTKRVGTGLGLSTCYGIARQASGELVVAETCLGVGTCFELRLPLDPGPVEPIVGDPVPFASKSERSLFILLIEDEEAVRDVTRRVLEGSGHRVEAAASGEEAQACMTRAGPFDLVVSDVVLPGLRGKPLVDALRALQPEVPVLFVSGYASGVLGTDIQRSVLIHKPYKREQLLEAAQRLAVPSTPGD